MKALNFNKNSWHYRLVSKLELYEAPHQKDIWGDGELYTVGDSGDICTYSKRVIFALFLVSIIIAAIILSLTIAVHTLLGIYFSLLANEWIFTEFGNVGMILSIATISMIGIYVAVEDLDDYYKRKSNKKSNKPDSFMKNAYRSWKNKFCIPIDFK